MIARVRREECLEYPPPHPQNSLPALALLCSSVGNICWGTLPLSLWLPLGFWNTVLPTTPSVSSWQCFPRVISLWFFHICCFPLMTVHISIASPSLKSLFFCQAPHWYNDSTVLTMLSILFWGVGTCNSHHKIPNGCEDFTQQYACNLNHNSVLIF